MTIEQLAAKAKEITWDEQERLLINHIINGACRELYSRAAADLAIASLVKAKVGA